MTDMADETEREARIRRHAWSTRGFEAAMESDRLERLERMRRAAAIMNHIRRDLGLPPEYSTPKPKPRRSDVVDRTLGTPPWGVRELHSDGTFRWHRVDSEAAGRDLIKRLERGDTSARYSVRRMGGGKTDRDVLERTAAPSSVTLLRTAPAGDGNTMHGHFAVFNTFTKIESLFEGRFMERISPGAFADSFKTRASSIRVLFQHGADPAIGNKPLGAPDVLREDATGAYFEVALFDAGYVRDLKPAIAAGQLGASFRFKVTADSWVDTGKKHSANPEGLPERTISGVDLYEFGPVTWPAYPDASAGLRDLR